jgi:D-alanyl-D-alanine carboxypeptidase
MEPTIQSQTALPISPLDAAPSATAGIPYIREFLFSLIFIAAGFGMYTYLSDTAAAQVQAQSQSAAAAATTALRDSADAAFAAVQLQAQSAIVVDTTTNTVLYSRNPYAQLPLASITKVPLVLAVSEALPTESSLTLTYGVGGSGTTDTLPAGSSWKTKDLMDFTLVGSSNDGAEALARAADEPLRARYADAQKGTATLWLMNKLVKDLHLRHTYFLNPTGLDESETLSGAYGSAADMALLFAYAASSSSDLFAATALKSVTITAADGRTATASNTDQALDDIPGLIMGKTGYTDLAGGNLGIVADVVPGHRIVAIVLGSTRDGRFSDMRSLVHAAEATFATTTPSL